MDCQHLTDRRVDRTRRLFGLPKPRHLPVNGDLVGGFGFGMGQRFGSPEVHRRDAGASVPNRAGGRLGHPAEGGRVEPVGEGVGLRLAVEDADARSAVRALHHLFDPAVVQPKGGRTPLLREQLGEPTTRGEGRGEEIADKVRVEHRDGCEFYEAGPTTSGVIRSTEGDGDATWPEGHRKIRPANTTICSPLTFPEMKVEIEVTALRQRA